MNNYPIEKYKYFTNGHKVIAVSSYAGKTVRGVANCSSTDEFSFEKGKQLAAARCALKIANKRVVRAQKKYKEANKLADDAYDYRDKMEEYLDDAYEAQGAAEAILDTVLNQL